MDTSVATAPGRIVIDGEMTIYAAAALRDQLFAFVQASREPLQIDLSRVGALDTAGLQLLLMLKRIALSAGVDVTLSQTSTPVQDLLALCGIDASLSIRSERTS